MAVAKYSNYMGLGFARPKQGHAKVSLIRNKIKYIVTCKGSNSNSQIAFKPDL